MGGKNDKDNLVELTPEEHYLVHQLLVKIYPNNFKLAFAANAMCINNEFSGRSCNKLFGWLRRRLSESNRQMYVDKPNLRKIRSERMKRTHEENPGLRKAQSERLKENGIFTIQPPWKSNKATEVSLEIWKMADVYYEWWKINQTGYTVMAKHFGFSNKTTPHETMVKKFKTGWIPKEDPDWVNFFNL
ncbi:putative homing endonuclease [Salmonella phage rabagast]|nr:homing endonuclease [Salmonella phage rabagast]QIQ61771.1 putative homing endonuclease [Salmonella phage rabagast]